MQTSVHHDLPFPVQAHSWERLNLQIIHSFECMWWTEQSPGHVVIKRTSVETGLKHATSGDVRVHVTSA